MTHSPAHPRQTTPAARLRASRWWFLLLAGPLLAGGLETGWTNPPVSARIRAYWWWLNGNVTRAAITRDLEEMKAKGFGGALICDAGGAEQDGNDRVPPGPTFLSPEWRELYRHTLTEAHRLGLELSLNIQSGWNLGGPMVSADDAAKKLVWTEAVVQGPTRLALALPKPTARDGYYRDLFVLAYPQPSPPPGSPPREPVQNWELKALHRALHFSAPDTSPLLIDLPDEPGEEDTHSQDVLDLTSRLGPDGILRWDAPGGAWQVLRFGCTIGDHSRVSTSSDGWKGYALDVLDAGAFQRYWGAVVEPLLTDAGPLAGHTLKYLHTDSWEIEVINWTPSLREEFRQRRGYDLLPFLPTIAGRIVDSRPVSNRFLHDFRKTLGDLAVDHHYRLFREGARRHGLEIHPESGGPHAVPVDAQRCLGFNDVPMSEFWAWSWRHRVGESNRFFVKQPASAAHTYGHRLVAAEGFTTIGPHWQETLWDNLKPTFDHALCEGLNLLVWHAFVCSPPELGVPGIQYFAGTHLNPNTTWWPKGEPFFAYLNRCQWMLQQGLFVADACYYYGDHVPNFAQLKRSDPARVLPGYDYDVLTEEALLTRLECRSGRLVLPDGMSYRVLVLPQRAAVSLPVLRKVKRLVEAGATVIGPRPQTATGLEGYPESDREIAALAEALWGAGTTDALAAANRQEPPSGRVINGRSARDVLLADGIRPDFEFEAVVDANPPDWGAPRSVPWDPVLVDYIHRRAGEVDIYFVASRTHQPLTARCAFRVANRIAELWDPVSGEREPVTDVVPEPDRTGLRLRLGPYGSAFVVFRPPGSSEVLTARAPHDPPPLGPELAGPWQVRFDPRWGGPEAAEFEHLVDWTRRPEPGIRYYSGTATYRKTFDVPAELAGSGRRLWLDLGRVRELAEVRVNGRPLGVCWAPPFRVELTGAVTATGNTLEIEVVNFWPNRIIGDQLLPTDQRFTRTNVRKLTAENPLMESGLLGPVRLVIAPPRSP